MKSPYPKHSFYNPFAKPKKLFSFSQLKIFSSPSFQKMKIARLSSFLYEICGFGTRHGFHSNFFSTMAKRSRRFVKPWKDSSHKLYSRISPVGDRNISIVPILDQWVEEGRSVDEESLRNIIMRLRYYKRYNHALEVSKWMTDKRYFELSSSDAAIRLDLISRAQGVDQAEKYFNNLSQRRKGLGVYCALINSYASARCVEKAEAVMQEIRDLGYAKNAGAYNPMLSLYCKTGNMEKLDALLKEMEENDIVRNNFTLSIQLNGYATVMDIDEMDKIVALMESDPDPYWIDYSAAATAYIKAGLFDKALEMMKKFEACLRSNSGVDAYNTLLTQYEKIGRKDEVLRVWSLYKEKCKVYNQGYKRVMNSLVKLGDIETADKIYYEWESQGLTYDMKVPNIMIGAYSKKGLIEKAEALIDRAVSKGGKLDAWTWYHMVEGYLQIEEHQKAAEMMKKAITISDIGWKLPDIGGLIACLEYLKGAGDAEQLEELVKLLLDRDIISSDLLEELSINKDEKLSYV